MDKADGSRHAAVRPRARATGRPRCWTRWRSRASGCRRRYEGPEVTGRVTRRGRRRDRAARRARRWWPAAATRRRARSASARSRRASCRLTLGTSGVVFAPPDAPLIEPEGRLHAFCHAVPGALAPDGRDAVARPAACAGIATRSRRAPSFDDAGRRGRGGAAGQRGAALPALPHRASARRTPIPLARGAFVGLTRAPRRGASDARGAGGRRLRPARLLRADAARPGWRRSTQVRVSGGGARERAVAADPGRRARRRAGDRQQRPRARPTARRCWPASARARGRTSTAACDADHRGHGPRRAGRRPGRRAYDDALPALPRRSTRRSSPRTTACRADVAAACA